MTKKVIKRKTEIGECYKLSQLSPGDTISLGDGKLLVISDFIVDVPGVGESFLMIDPNSGEAFSRHQNIEDHKFRLVDKVH